MADYYGATLSVPAHLITPEIKAMIDEYIQEHETEDSVVDEIFTLVSYEARWGEFEEIEEALVDAGIPFDRETVADYGNPAFTMYFRPGITPTPQYVCDVIDVGEVKGCSKLVAWKPCKKNWPRIIRSFYPWRAKTKR